MSIVAYILATSRIGRRGIDFVIMAVGALMLCCIP